MEGLVGFAVVNVLTELHFVAGGRRLRPDGELLLVSGKPVVQVVDDVLGLVGLVDIPPDRQVALGVLGVAVVEVDQELLSK